MGIKAFFEKRLTLLLTWVIPACIITSYSFLALQPDLRISVPALVGVTAIVTIILSAALYVAERNMTTWSPSVIIVVSVVLRLLFLFRPPELSDDIYRYLWDGLQTLNGQNPYALAPSNVPLMNQTYNYLLKLVNHSDLITIYPPAAQVIFALGALLGKSVLGIKLLLITLDIISCCMLIRLLSMMNLPVSRSVLYAWHPLPVIEIAASGHVDGAGVFFFFAALLLLAKQSAGCPSNRSNVFAMSPMKRSLVALSSGIAFSFAVLVKLFPSIFLPTLLLFVGRRGVILFLTGILVGSAVLIFPFFPDLQNMFITLNTYLRTWEFSGLLFRNLRMITSSGNTARLMLTATFILSMLLLYSRLWFKKERSPFRSLYYITLVFLFLTPTLHPWYVLYLACLLPFISEPAGLALSWSIFLSYRVIIPYFLLGKWIEDDYTPALIWIAPCGAYLLTLVTKKMRDAEQIL